MPRKEWITSLPITNLTGTTEPLTLYRNLRRTRRVNGEKQLSFFALPGDEAYAMIEAENAITFAGTEYVTRQVNETTAGTRSIKKVEAVERFFVTLIDSPQPRIHNGSMTFNAALTFVFENTPYSFNIVDPFTAERFENFGRENALSLFNTIIERYGAEYTVAGTTVTLRKSKGARTDFAFRYGVNVKTLDKQIETHNIATAIRGYGGEPDDNGNYPIEETYISPHADLYGELRWADPVVDERLTTVAGMQARLKRVLIDEPQISVTIDFADLRAAGYTADVPNEGDWGYIIYEPMDDFIAEARIVEIVEEFDANGRAIKTNVTLSNIRRKLTDVMTRFSRTAKQVDKLFAGQAKLPYNVLDDAVKLATQALQSAQTELKFENGIIAVDKTNANNLVLFNSAGIGISDDGGATFKTAMTGHGIVADVITAGQLNANNVTIYGGFRDNYTNIFGDTIEARGTHTREWFGDRVNEDVRLRLQHGYFIAESMKDDQRLYISNRGISTTIIGSGADDDGESGGDESTFWGSGVIEFYSYRYEPDIRGLTLSSNRGTVALKAYFRDTILDAGRDVKLWAGRGAISFEPHRDVRAGTNQFMLRVKENASTSETDGWLSFGSANPDIPHASGLRFQKTTVGDPIIWATNGNGDKGTGAIVAKWLKAGYFEGDIRTNTTNLYAMVNDVFRVTDMRGFNNGNPTYKHIAGDNVFIGQLRPLENNHDLYLTAGSGREVRVTNLLGYNGGNIGWQSIKASEFLEASSMTYKQNIKPLEYNVLPILNKFQVVSYNMNSDADDGNYSRKHVGFISELSPEIASQDLKAISLYKISAFNTKGIQEVDAKVTKNERDVKWLQDAVLGLQEALKKQENEILRLRLGGILR